MNIEELRKLSEESYTTKLEEYSKNISEKMKSFDERYIKILNEMDAKCEYAATLGHKKATISSSQSLLERAADHYKSLGFVTKIYLGIEAFTNNSIVELTIKW